MNLDFVLNKIDQLQNPVGYSYVYKGDLVQFESAILDCLECHSRVKEYISENEFENKEQEILFFKELKPLITSNHIYYLKLFAIHSKMPIGSTDLIKSYLKTELNKIDNFYNNNIEFCRYYISGSTHNDELYFLRGSFKFKLDLDQYYIDVDRSFSTSHGFKVGRILAHKNIKLYIENLLTNIDSPSSRVQSGFSQMQWSGTKTDMVELIYGLQESGMIKADIAAIAQHFQSIFEIDLGDFYKTWTEIRARKKDRTKLFSKLIVDLNRRIDDYDS